MYAVIMAGGVGRRFWPLSRSEKPKQFLNILGGETLLQQTARRLQPLVSRDDTIILTGRDHHREVLKALPDIPPENVVAEPRGKNTAACMAMGAVRVRRREPDAVMAILPADHYIKDAGNFRNALEAAGEVARMGEYLVTLGVEPTRAETGYGYIEKRKLFDKLGGFEVYEAERFVEKPDAERAEQFHGGGRHLWNSGIFVLTVSTAYALIERHLPRLYRGMLEVEKAKTVEETAQAMSRVYEGLESISIDHGVAEKASGVMVIPVSFGWSDVGSWRSVHELLPKDEGDNVLIGRSVCKDTTNTLIYSSGRLVAAMGLEDMVVIDAGDALLICPMERDQEIKKLIELMEEQGMGEYL
jgi:mannose-1-phosphate guanylyltransferase